MIFVLKTAVNRVLVRVSRQFHDWLFQDGTIPPDSPRAWKTWERNCNVSRKSLSRTSGCKTDRTGVPTCQTIINTDPIRRCSGCFGTVHGK